MSKSPTRALLLHASAHFGEQLVNDRKYAIQLLEKESILNTSSEAKKFEAHNSLLVFSSQHAVETVSQLISLKGRVCAAVGPATAKRLTGLGALVSVMPKQLGMAGLTQQLVEFLDSNPEIVKVIYFRGEVIKVPLVLPGEVVLEEVMTYRMRAKNLDTQRIELIFELISSGKGVVGITSRQVFDQLLNLVRDRFRDRAEFVLSQLSIAVFVESISQYVKDRGVQVVFSSSSKTLEGFLCELDSYCKAS